MNRATAHIPAAILGVMLLGGDGAPANAGARVPEPAFPNVPACGTRGADPPPLARAGGPGFRDAVVPEAPIPVVVREEDGDLYLMQWNGLLADPVTPEVPFVVREGTVGVTIRAEALVDDFLVSVELLASDGTLLACHECPDAPAVGEVRTGRGTTQIPSTDRPGWELESGEYSFRVRVLPPPARAVDQAVVNAWATFRSDAALTVEHLLDLNFVYLPGSTLSAEIATTHPRFGELLDTIDEYLGPTGIRIGRVTHVDLDRPEFSAIATWEEAGEMFRTSRHFPEARALNVYCVEKFVAPLNPVVGLSGGIPGPVRNGTRDSGIAIRTSPLFTCSNCLPAFGSLFAHEIGHYLGFYHTTEADQESWDPLSDTPECVEGGLGDCPDFDYVMFPLIHSANTIWSPHQVLLSGTHPIVRTLPVIGDVRERVPVLAGNELRLAPNPFRDAVQIDWDLGRAQAVFHVYDVSGRLVRTLRGAHVVSWDGQDRDGHVVAPGTYFVRARSGDEERTGRIVRRP